MRLSGLLLLLCLPTLSCGPSRDECITVYYETANIPAVRLTTEQSVKVKRCADAGKYNSGLPDAK